MQIVPRFFGRRYRTEGSPPAVHHIGGYAYRHYSTTREQARRLRQRANLAIKFREELELAYAAEQANLAPASLSHNPAVRAAAA